jgi:hypothetical protein
MSPLVIVLYCDGRPTIPQQCDCIRYRPDKRRHFMQFVRRSISAPASNSNWTTPVRSFCAALLGGVCPWTSFLSMSTLGPPFNSNWTTSVCPFPDGQLSRVRPDPSTSSLALAFSGNWTTSVSPFSAAQLTRVRPFVSFVSMSAPERNSNRTTPECPFPT